MRKNKDRVWVVNRYVNSVIARTRRSVEKDGRDRYYAVKESELAAWEAVVARAVDHVKDAEKDLKRKRQALSKVKIRMMLVKMRGSDVEKGVS